MAKKSKIEQAAETALAEAKAAVKRAEAAARKVDKKARERAAELAARLSVLAGDASDSWAKSAKARTEPAPTATPTKPGSQRTTNGPSDAGKKAKQSATADDLESLTVQQLRIRAKDAGLHGYSSLGKANLVKAIRAAK